MAQDLGTGGPVGGDQQQSGLVTIFNPVIGGTYQDTMGAPRDGGARAHEGTDIFARRHTPVLAMVPGVVTRVGVSGSMTSGAGLRVWVKGDDGRYYFYAHLQGTTVEEGDRVAGGQQIGTVGNSGNAHTTQPHLHISINTTDLDEDAGGPDQPWNPALELSSAGLSSGSSATSGQYDPTTVGVPYWVPGGGGTHQPASGVAAQPGNTQANTTTATTQNPANPTNDTVVVNSDGTLTVDDGALPPNASDAEVEAYIRKNYPTFAWLLDNPEFREILFKAAREDLDATEVAEDIRGTDYWQTHGPTSRAFDQLIATDGRAASALVASVKNDLDGLMRRAGLELNDFQLGEAAKRAIREGWFDINGNLVNAGKVNDFIAYALRTQGPGELRDGEYRDAITGRLAYYGPNGEAGTASKAEIEKHAKEGDVIKSHVMPDGRTAWYIEGQNIQERTQLPTGEVTFNAEWVMNLARQYLVPITRAQAEDWALRMLEGNASEESITSHFIALARHEYAARPDILAALEAGTTPLQFFGSHVATVAQILELGEDQVDLMDPKWSWITEVSDDSGGTRTPTRGEVAQRARDLPEFAKTRQYKSTTADYAVGLSKFLGLAA